MLPYWDRITFGRLGEIALIVSLFIRLISCWKTPQNTGNTLSELQEIKHFLGGMPPDPPRSLHLRWSTRLSQNPSYGLICCPMTYTY
jgi:hypothetical protein